jgi:hypothetical protein
MSPTAELRWVRRIDQYTMREVKVLQQKWVQHHIPPGKTEAPSEWRDVPTVFEGCEKWD